MASTEPEKKEKKHKKSTLSKLKSELLGQQSAAVALPASEALPAHPKAHAPPKDRDTIVQNDFAPLVAKSPQQSSSEDLSRGPTMAERASPEEKKKPAGRRERVDSSPREVINPIFGAKLRASTSGGQAPAAAHNPSPRDHSSTHSSPRVAGLRAADTGPPSPVDLRSRAGSERSPTEETPPHAGMREPSETSSSSERRLERSKSESRLTGDSRSRRSTSTSTNSSSSRNGVAANSQPLRAAVSAQPAGKAHDEVRTENPLFQRQEPSVSPRHVERLVQNPVYRPRFMLVTVLSSQNFAALGTLVDIMHVKQSDQISRHMFTLVHNDPRRLTRLMRWSLRREFAREEAEQLFRHDSVPTKLLTAYFKMHGQAYLHAALKPTVRRVLDDAPFEVDPQKLGGRPAEGGPERIRSLMRTLLTDVMRAAASLPPQLRRVVRDIQKIKDRSEDQHRIAFCALFFLRFVSSAMVAPETLGITEPPTTDTRRGLVLLSKVLQALVTGVAFGEKEPYMIPLNSIIAEHSAFVASLIAKITHKSKRRSTLRPTNREKPLNPYASDPPEEALEYFQIEIASCKEKISKRLAKDSPQAHSLFVSYASSLKAPPRRVSVEPTQMDTQGSLLKGSVSVDSAMRRSASEDSLHSSVISKDRYLHSNAPKEPGLAKIVSTDASVPISASASQTSFASYQAPATQPPEGAAMRSPRIGGGPGGSPSSAIGDKVRSSATVDARYLQLRLEAEAVSRQTLERQVRALRADLEREVELRKHLILRLSRYEGAEVFDEFPEHDTPATLHTGGYAAPLPPPPPGARARGISM